jgi:hypothetical protein
MVSISQPSPIRVGGLKNPKCTTVLLQTISLQQDSQLNYDTNDQDRK